MKTIPGSLKSVGVELVRVGQMEAMEHRCSLLLEALDRIARPLWWMQEDQRTATGSINGIHGARALSLSESAEYLKDIARAALEKDKQLKKTHKKVHNTGTAE